MKYAIYASIDLIATTANDPNFAPQQPQQQQQSEADLFITSC